MQSAIDYDHIDYGMEVNYLLYMYFQFFQDKYKQRFLENCLISFF